MIRKAYIKNNTYQDSVSLMRLSSMAAKQEGVKRVSVMMGTALNKKVLEEIDLFTPEVEAAQPSDMMLIVEAESEDAARLAIDTVDAQLNSEAQEKIKEGKQLPVSIDEALKEDAGYNLVAISTPGEFAAAEAMKALQDGLNVFLFSDNVSIDDEVALKEYARDHDLLVMGPDCGTSVLQGVPLGFANVVSRGNIGLIGASGTGLQEVMCRIQQMGGGISHAIGVGSHDLSLQTGGISMMKALDMLEKDAQTSVIVLVSKPPEASVAMRVWKRISGMHVPVVVCFLDSDVIRSGGKVFTADTLEDAARIALSLAKGEGVPKPFKQSLNYKSGTKGLLRGLYSGGTLAYEAKSLLERSGLKVRSNLTDDSELKLADPFVSEGNCVVDMGDDRFTVGRPHPMIDYTQRLDRLKVESEDKDVKVFIMDILLGYGSNKNPAEKFAPVINECLKNRPDLKIVIHLCGTEDDEQRLSVQEKLFEEAGAYVETNHSAAVMKALDFLNQADA